MPMHNPPHPGEIVKWECLEPLGLSITKAADGLGRPLPNAFRSCERERQRFGRYGCPSIQRVWLYTRNVAEDADGI